MAGRIGRARLVSEVPKLRATDEARAAVIGQYAVRVLRAFHAESDDDAPLVPHG